MKRFLVTVFALLLAGAAGAAAMHYMPLSEALQKRGIASGSTAVTPVSAPSAAAPMRVVPKVALHVNQNDAGIMNLALNNAENVVSYYKSKGQEVAVEIVTYGPGLHMLRADTSPIKARLASLPVEMPQVRLSACQNTQERMSKAENKEIELLDVAKVVPSGVVRLIELQQQGYAYVKP